MSKQHSLAHHFEDLDQQYDSANLGMWLFLITEVLFFGGLFFTYTLYRGYYPEAFAHGSRHLSVMLGAFNTAVLISSSFTMVLSVHYAREGKQKATLLNLLLTLGLGLIFLGVKTIEYSDKFKHHLVPGSHFSFPGFNEPGIQIFYSLYFGMTGLHAFHMVVGMGYLLVLIRQTTKGRFTKEFNTPIDLFGLYWHFVDIVWIFLFPLLYLIERP